MLESSGRTEKGTRLSILDKGLFIELSLISSALEMAKDEQYYR
jgi:hypothetical protein